ncbi:Gram-negative bacterial tonB protein [compost metagenome]
MYSQTDLDVLPVPENGMKQFYKFFNKNYTASTKGKIAVLFVIEEDGSLSNFNIVKNTPKEIGEETIRILKMGPKWIPGKRKNQSVRSSYTLSILL